jgi:hypothetical protein
MLSTQEPSKGTCVMVMVNVVGLSCATTKITDTRMILSEGL